MRHLRFLASVGLALVGTVAPATVGDVIYETDDPFGGPFGLWGPDVCIDQSVGVRFTPDADYTLDRVSLWFMNNSATVHPLVEVSLRTDDDSVPGESVPGDEILESWTFNVSTLGWNPMLEVMDSVDHPLLEAGVHYWVVCESQAACGLDGVWNMAGIGSGFMAYGLGYGQAWQPGGSGAVAATIIEGTVAEACPEDINSDGVVNVLDLIDLLLCFGLPASPGCEAEDVNGDSTVNVLDLIDLLLAFGTSCP
ncbi:MAG: hypothetical protein ACYSTY_04580 [Planctomycetota bacterium]